MISDIQLFLIVKHQGSGGIRPQFLSAKHETVNHTLLQSFIV